MIVDPSRGFLRLSTPLSGGPLFFRLMNIFQLFSSAQFDGEDELGHKFRCATDLKAK
jgi:hypothetical protein